MILIGVDVPEAFWVIEECRGRPSEPYALRTTLGWSLIGPRSCERPNLHFENCSVNFASVRVDRLNDRIERLWKLDKIPLQYSDSMELSKNDRYALKLMRDSKSLVDGHYQIALPWRPGAPQLNNNRNQALIRLSYLRRRLDRNPDLKKGTWKLLKATYLKDTLNPLSFLRKKDGTFRIILCVAPINPRRFALCLTAQRLTRGRLSMISCSKDLTSLAAYLAF